MFSFFTSKKKKAKPSEPVVEKDWKAISERLEKKIISLENEIRELTSSLQQKDKQIIASQEETETQKRLLQQEKRWREKEETDSKKDKEREKDILSELEQARDSWQKQQALRIQFEQEVRELRTQKDNLMLEYQQTVNALKQKEKEITFLTKDIKTLNYQNVKLQRKKQADQWVSKNDFVRLEKILKRERRQLVLFKTQVPQSAWPQELRPLRENKPEQPTDT